MIFLIGWDGDSANFHFDGLIFLMDPSKVIQDSDGMTACLISSDRKRMQRDVIFTVSVIGESRRPGKI